MALYQTVRTRNGEIRVPLNQPSRNSEPKKLPYWLQIFVAISSIISSFGIVVAIAQLYASNEQFNKANEGILIFRPTMDVLSLGDSTSRSKLKLSVLYPRGVVENVGHNSIQFRIKNFHYHKNGFHYGADSSFVIAEDVLYPTEKIDVALPMIRLVEKGDYILPSDINKLNIAASYTIEYNDVDKREKVTKVMKVFDVGYDDENEKFYMNFRKVDDIHQTFN